MVRRLYCFLIPSPLRRPCFFIPFHEKQTYGRIDLWVWTPRTSFEKQFLSYLVFIFIFLILCESQGFIRPSNDESVSHLRM